MSKSNATEVDMLSKMYKATAIPWDAATDIEIHLHTADPGEGGDSTTNEAAYTSYAPAVVDRDGVAWTGTNPIANGALIQFPQCTGSTAACTHVSTTPVGSTQILHSGALAATLNVSNGIQPQFAAGALTVAED